MKKRDTYLILLAVIINGLFLSVITYNTSKNFPEKNDLKPSEEFSSFDWENEFKGPGSTIGVGVGEDIAGNLYLLADSTDLILVKYSSEGSFIWSKNLIDVGSEMVIDSTNNIYIAGTNNSDICLIKYDINGNMIWIRSWDSGLNDYVREISLDSFGNIYLSGSALYNTSEVGSGDMVVLKYNSNGDLLLNKTWGQNDLTDQAESLVIDSSGNIYLAGSYYDLGLKWELVKLNNEGDYQWNYTCLWGSSGAHVCHSIALDSDENVYLAGYTDPTGGPSMDVGLIKLTASGDYKWNKTWDGGLNDGGICIAIDSQDYIFIAGTTETGDPENDIDALFLKYDTDGNQIWNTTWERITEWFATGYWFDGFYEIFISPVDNDVYLAGTSKVGTNDNNATIVKYENSVPNEAPYFYNKSTDFDVIIGDSGYELFWHVIDPEGDNHSYWIERNDQLVQNGFWDNDAEINFIETETLPLGLYNYTCFVNDAFGLSNQSSIFITVKEIIPPYIIFELSESFVSPLEPQYFHASIEIQCIINDDSPIIWVYCCENSSGYFINQSMNSLGEGNWSVTINIAELDWNDMLSLSFYAIDTWGNIGELDNLGMLYNIKINDFIAPNSQISYIPYTELFTVNQSTLFSFNADDFSGSGIAIIKYKINDSSWMDYNTPFNLSDYGFGFWSISYYSVDNAGNIENINTIIVHLIEFLQPNPSKETIPSFHILILLSLIGLVTVILILKRQIKL